MPKICMCLIVVDDYDNGDDDDRDFCTTQSFRVRAGRRGRVGSPQGWLNNCILHSDQLKHVKNSSSRVQDPVSMAHVPTKKNLLS